MRILSFDARGDFAFFRQPYTTTSGLSFAVPPRTAVFGILGAVLGIESGGGGKSEFMDFFCKENLEFGIEILKPIERKMLGTNYIQTKSGSEEPRIRATIELLKNPHYRIYLKTNEKLLNKIKKNIEEKTAHYTPYFGISEFIATLENPQFYEFTVIGNNLSKIHLNSCLYLFGNFKIHYEVGKIIISERQQFHMNSFRRTEKYVDVIHESNAKSLCVSLFEKIDNIYLLSESDKVVMLV